MEECRAGRVNDTDAGEAESGVGQGQPEVSGTASLRGTSTQDEMDKNEVKIRKSHPWLFYKSEWNGPCYGVMSIWNVPLLY